MNKKDTRITVFDIQRNSFVDGPGIRTTVFFKGCNLRCAWCHNPEGQKRERELAFFKNSCTGCGKCKEICKFDLSDCDLCGACAAACMSCARRIIGKEYTAAEIMTEIRRDRLFYETSGGGVTFSGGECLLGIDMLEELLRTCRSEGIHTAVDTAGAVPFEYFERVIPYTDIFLYDVKMLSSERHKFYTGIGNELILDNLAKLLSLGVTVTVRIPVIAGVNDTEEEMRGIRALLDSHGGCAEVELLPYHGMGEYKYSAIGRKPERFSPPGEERLSRLREIFLHK